MRLNGVVGVGCFFTEAAEQTKLMGRNPFDSDICMPYSTDVSLPERLVKQQVFKAC